MGGHSAGAGRPGLARHRSHCHKKGSLLIPLALMEALAIYGMLVAILLVGKI